MNGVASSSSLSSSSSSSVSAGRTLVASLPVTVHDANSSSQLLLVQSLLRPPTRPYDLTRVRRVALKPRHGRIELEIAHDPESNTMDVSAGFADSFRLAGSFSAPFSNPYASSSINLPSSHAPVSSVPCMLAVGVVRQGNLHMVPVSAIAQLKPSFKNLPVHAGAEYGVVVRDTTEDDLAMDDADDVDEDDQMTMLNQSASGAGDEGVPVVVTVQKRETERQQAARQRSWAYMAEREAAERWVDCSLSRSPVFPLEDVVASEDVSMEDAQGASSSNGLRRPSSVSSSNLRTMLLLSSPSDALPSVESVLRQSYCCALPQLVSSLRLNVPASGGAAISLDMLPTNIRTQLDRVAVYSRGLWFLRSDMLFEKDSRRELSRDLILGCLHHDHPGQAPPTSIASNVPLSALSAKINSDYWIGIRAVDDKTVVDMSSNLLPPSLTIASISARSNLALQLVEEIFTQLFSRRGVKWFLKALPYFLNDEHARASVFWEKRRSVCEKLLATDEPQRRVRERAREKMPGGPLRVNVNLGSGSSLSNSTPSGSLSSSFLSNGTSSAATSLPSARKGSATAAAAAAAAAASASGGSVIPELSKFLIDLFSQHGVLSVASVRAAINLHKAQLPPSDPLVSLSESDFAATMESVCRPFTSVSVRILKSVGDPSVDEFRDAIVGLLQERGKLKKTEILDGVRERTGREVSQAVYSRVLKEVAERQGIAWAPKVGSS
eukprot:ANDGO_03481.mRNA.1 hypothetical protein CAOG_04960